MIYPTIPELTKEKYNRYELAIAIAKGARLITDEYVRQRLAAESAAGNGKESDKPIAAMIDKKLKDEKAVKISIDKLDAGEFFITEEFCEDKAENEEAAEEAEETAEDNAEAVTE